jgi:hypothetical protein
LQRQPNYASWVSVLLTGTIAITAELYFDRLRAYEYVWDVGLVTGLKMGAVDMLETGVWIVLLVWLAVLFDLTPPPTSEVLVENPALVGPPEPSHVDSARTSLPESR